jgi:hypothetical protein
MKKIGWSNGFPKTFYNRDFEGASIKCIFDPTKKMKGNWKGGKTFLMITMTNIKLNIKSIQFN